MYHSEVDHALKEYELQINTALSSTQVVDGFMVKETRNIQDTITWYVGCTQGSNGRLQGWHFLLLFCTSAYL